MTGRRTSLEVVADILSRLARNGGAMPKYHLLNASQVTYANPRLREIVSKGLVTEEMRPNPNMNRDRWVVSLTAKGRRALAAWKALEAELE